MGRCVKCGFAIERVDSSGPYKLLCSNKGVYKRYGDKCSDFWDKDEMKKFIDKTIPLVEDK